MTLEDRIKDERVEERQETFYNSIRDMLEMGLSEDKILEKYKDRITVKDIERLKNGDIEGNCSF